MKTQAQEDKSLEDEPSANLAMEAKSLINNQCDALIVNDERNPRQKISDTMEIYSTALGYRGIDDMYAKVMLEKIYAYHNGAKPSRSDEMILKFMKEIGEVKGYKDMNRETVVQTNIRPLDHQQILKS